MLLSSYEENGIEAIDLETTPEEIYVLYPEGGLLTHANHFESVVAQTKMIDTGVSTSLCSLYRSNRARAMLQPNIGAITVDDVKSVLNDRFSAPHSLCRAPVKNSRGGYTMTVASIIMDTRAQKMSVCSSPHNNDEYVQYSVNRN